jgi:hypothetical protein
MCASPNPVLTALDQAHERHDANENENGKRCSKTHGDLVFKRHRIHAQTIASEGLRREKWKAKRRVLEGGVCFLTAFAVSRMLDMECALLNTANKFSAETVDGLSFLSLGDAPESHIVCGNEPESTHDQSDSMNSVEYRIALQAP